MFAIVNKLLQNINSKLDYNFLLDSNLIYFF